MSFNTLSCQTGISNFLHAQAISPSLNTERVEVIDVEEVQVLDDDKEFSKRDVHAKMNYATMQTAKKVTMKKSLQLYIMPPKLKSEHGVVCIRCNFKCAGKLIVKVPFWCMSRPEDSLLPKVYDQPRKIVIHDPSKKEDKSRFVTPDLVELYSMLLQSDDLEREDPRRSSQPLSCQALAEGYRVMISATPGDAFYAQCDAHRAMCLLPATSVAKAHILSRLRLPAAHSQIDLHRFATWGDVKDYCCGGAD